MTSIKTIAFITLFTMLSCEHEAQTVLSSENRGSIPVLPLKIDKTSIVPLRELVNTDLQNKLQTAINHNSKWKRLVNQKKMAAGVVDLSDPYHTRYARINGNLMMYAASLYVILFNGHCEINHFYLRMQFCQ